MHLPPAKSGQDQSWLRNLATRVENKIQHAAKHFSCQSAECFEPAEVRRPATSAAFRQPAAASHAGLALPTEPEHIYEKIDETPVRKTNRSVTHRPALQPRQMPVTANAMPGREWPFAGTHPGVHASLQPGGMHAPQARNAQTRANIARATRGQPSAEEQIADINRQKELARLRREILRDHALRPNPLPERCNPPVAAGTPDVRPPLPAATAGLRLKTEGMPPAAPLQRTAESSPPRAAAQQPPVARRSRQPDGSIPTVGKVARMAANIEKRIDLGGLKVPVPPATHWQTTAVPRAV